jgi:hypothetical protein
MKFSRKILTRFGLTLALMIGLSAQASYAHYDVSATLNGPQANAGAGSGSAGVGALVGTFDSDTKQLSWSIQWSGLTGTATAMHFHGPASPTQNAGAQVTAGVAGPPVIGNAILSATQEADLLAGLWYLNLHTTTSPGGEIRGQVAATETPSPSAVPGAGLLLVFPLMIAGGIGLIRRERQR